MSRFAYKILHSFYWIQGVSIISGLFTKIWLSTAVTIIGRCSVQKRFSKTRILIWKCLDGSLEAFQNFSPSTSQKTLETNFSTSRNWNFLKSYFHLREIKKPSALSSLNSAKLSPLITIFSFIFSKKILGLLLPIIEANAIFR